MILDLDTLVQLHSLHVIVEVSEEVYGNPGAIEAVRHKLWRELDEAAHTYGTFFLESEIDLDIARPTDRTWVRKIRGFWSPPDHDVELRGGPLDGTVVAVPHRATTVTVPQLVGSPVFATESAPTAPAVSNLDYRYSGFDDVARRRVFTLPV